MPEIPDPSQINHVQNMDKVAYDPLRFLSDVNGRVHKLETEGGVTVVDGRATLPDWYTDSAREFRGLQDSIRDGAHEPSVTLDFCKTYLKQQEVFGKAGVNKFENPLKQLLYDIGEENFAKAMREEGDDGELHQTLLSALDRANMDDAGSSETFLIPELKTLTRYYGLDSSTQLLGVRDAYGEQLHKLLLSEAPIRWMRSMDEKKVEDGQPFEIARQNGLEWMATALKQLGDITEDEALDYAFSSARRGKTEDFLKAAEVVEYFGAERLRRITSFTGICGLESYTVQQLERMEALAQNPEKAVSELEDHDVNIVMTNRLGDHNGVLMDNAKMYDDERGRTLFFEVTHLEDIYRKAVLLKRLGIKPSTLIIAAHAGRGQFFISDARDKDLKKNDIAVIGGRRLVEAANGGNLLPDGTKGYSMQGMKGMKKFIDEIMQPSRGKDDPDEAVGRKRIVLQACQTATKIDQYDLDIDGKKYKTGEESIASQLVRDLVENSTESKVDIFGAPENIQMARTTNGLKYTGPPKVGFEREPQHAIRVRYEDGAVTEEAVDEITLRK